MHPTSMNQSKDDQAKRIEDARREEQERRDLEDQLREFDAYGFYEVLEQWNLKSIPRPIPLTVHVTPLRQKVVLHQPMPVTRRDMSEVRAISSNAGRLLYLLRAIDQKGIECPYIHQQNRVHLEKAVEKCELIKGAGDLYRRGKGFWSRLRQLFNKPHLDGAVRDIEYFKDRLEAILMMCRHQEFAQDLMKFRKTVGREAIGTTALAKVAEAEKVKSKK